MTEETLRSIIQGIIMDKKGNRKRQLKSNSPADFVTKTYLEIAKQCFLAGKSQATKEILEEEIRFCQELWEKACEYTCDGWVLILAGNRMEDIKQQLRKLGEGGK